MLTKNALGQPMKRISGVCRAIETSRIKSGSTVYLAAWKNTVTGKKFILDYNKSIQSKNGYLLKKHQPTMMNYIYYQPQHQNTKNIYK